MRRMIIVLLLKLLLLLSCVGLYGFAEVTGVSVCGTSCCPHQMGSHPPRGALMDRHHQ